MGNFPAAEKKYHKPSWHYINFFWEQSAPAGMPRDRTEMIVTDFKNVFTKRWRPSRLTSLVLSSLLLLVELGFGQQSFHHFSNLPSDSRIFSGSSLNVPIYAIATRNEIPNSPSFSPDLIPAKPPGKSFRVAVLYFKLADDVFELGEETAGWPHTQVAPNWKGQFLVHTPFDSATFQAELDKRPTSLTAYYYQMSNGHLWLYGDEITYTGSAWREGYEPNENIRYQNWLDLNTEILQWLADQYDLSALDHDKNGAVDLILFICRARTKFGFAGEACLPISKEISARPGQPRITGASGTYQTDCYLFSATRHLVAHEMGHLLGFGSHVNGLHRWNLMSGLGEKPPHGSGVTMSAYEKNRLGWLEYEVIDKTTFDISLSNLTQSNRAIKIPIKGCDDYFVLENRQYSEPFEPYPALPGTGLLLYYVHNGLPSLVPADGRVTRVIARTSRGRGVFYNGDNSDLFGNYGKTEITPYTAPTASTPAVANTGIAIKNIRYVGKDIVFDVYHDYGEKAFPTITVASNWNLRSYPNPFNSRAKIFYQLPQSGHVKLAIYNQIGQEVATLVNEFQESWDYEVDFEGLNLPSGVYFHVLQTSAGRKSGKMVLLRQF